MPCKHKENDFYGWDYNNASWIHPYTLLNILLTHWPTSLLETQYPWHLPLDLSYQKHHYMNPLFPSLLLRSACILIIWNPIIPLIARLIRAGLSRVTPSINRLHSFLTSVDLSIVFNVLPFSYKFMYILYTMYVLYTIILK